MPLTWSRNPAFEQLPEPSLGDRITLHAEAAFRYVVGADVVAVKGKVISARMVLVSDRDTGSQITGGEVTGLVGDVATCEMHNLFSVTRKP